MSKSAVEKKYDFFDELEKVCGLKNKKNKKVKTEVKPTYEKKVDEVVSSLEKVASEEVNPDDWKVQEPDEIILTDEQNDAIKKFKEWFKQPKKERPFFFIAGYAGTGKTTLQKFILQDYKRGVLLAAFSGKAANVMREKTKHRTSTIHSLIYRLNEEKSKQDKLVWELNEESDLYCSKLLILDEVSMIDDEMWKDLLTFNVPILIFGDTFQLPPISGEDKFKEGNEDVLLTTIHRQALENPIVRLSMMLRQNEYIPNGSYDNKVLIINKNQTPDISIFTQAEQVICGLNKTRRFYNAKMREFYGYNKELPVVGDKIICLKNSRNYRLYNGMIGNIDKITTYENTKTKFLMDVNVDSNTRKDILTSTKYFNEVVDANEFEPSAVTYWDYGYVCTTHKAQGSEWNNGIIIDESYCFREHKNRWLYTAITRFSDRLLMIR